LEARGVKRRVSPSKPKNESVAFHQACRGNPRRFSATMPITKPPTWVKIDVGNSSPPVATSRIHSGLPKHNHSTPIATGVARSQNAPAAINRLAT